MNLFKFLGRKASPKKSRSRSTQRKLRVESLECRRVFSLNPTGLEQEMLELVNRARMNPVDEPDELFISSTPGDPNFFRSTDPDVNLATDFFNTSGSAFFSAFGSQTPVAPVAWNEGFDECDAGS